MVAEKTAKNFWGATFFAAPGIWFNCTCIQFKFSVHKT